MDFESITNLLNKLIVDKTDIRTGYNQINQLLADNKLTTIEINLDSLSNEFVGWLVNVIKKEPIPGDIKSIYFGMTNLSDPDYKNGKARTTVYISGSTITPEQNDDWACDTKYFPQRRYLFLKEFEKIDDLIKSNDSLSGAFEVLVFNGLLNLLVINVVRDLKDSFLTYQDRKLGLFKTDKKRERLSFGSGYDSGDLYLMGDLTNE